MAKKVKIINEDPSINFRIAEELKYRIHKEAALKNETVSTYLRDLLTEFFDGRLYEKEMAIYEDQKFINSTGFMQLVIWMYRKKTEKKCTSTARQLDDYIQTLKSINLQLPLNLREEFDIVLLDVLRVKNEEYEHNKEYKFGNTSYSNKGFNYEKLEHYLLNEVKNYYVVSIP
jgi:hypothetical protein